MKIALMMVTDGRKDFFDRTYAAMDAMIGARAFDFRIVVDDGQSRDYSEWLDHIGMWDLHALPRPEGKRGFGGAIQAGWDILKAMPDVDYVFHLEDDFMLSKYFSLRWMAGILDRNPDLAQLALKRQPVNAEEAKVGGFVYQFPDEYHQHLDEETGQSWYSQNLFFTTNPSLYRRSLLDVGWPSGEGSERRMTERLQALGMHFGFLGTKFDEPWVHHIGKFRTGVGY